MTIDDYWGFDDSDDWLRGLAWDLWTPDWDHKVHTYAELLKALGKMSVNHFLTLRAARAMPQELRDELVRKGFDLTPVSLTAAGTRRTAPKEDAPSCQIKPVLPRGTSSDKVDLAKWKMMPQAPNDRKNDLIKYRSLTTGSHATLGIQHPKTVTQAQRAHASSTLDALIRRNPVNVKDQYGLPIYTDVKFTDSQLFDMLFGRGTQAERNAAAGVTNVAQWQGHIEHANIIIRGEYLRRPKLLPKSHYFAPAGQGHDELEYFMAHEYGHVLTMTDMSHIADRGRLWERWQGDKLSEYATKNEFEAAAEAFAEWFLSEGKTTNKMVLEYQKVFKWR